jgi:hypothetical protein
MPISYLLVVYLPKVRSFLPHITQANLCQSLRYNIIGVGLNIPDPKGFKKLDNGVIVPCGKEIKAKVPNAVLQYNEFIVYDISQIKMKYLIRLKFHHK